MSLSPEAPVSERTLEMVDVFERFKSYLDQKVETLTSGLVSQATNGNLKLKRAAAAGKLKFHDNRDQFLFDSDLQGTLDKTANFLAARDSRKSLRHHQKMIKLADKSKASWLAVKEYQTEELASDSEDEKRIKKAQERALKKKKEDAFNFHHHHFITN